MEPKSFMSFYKEMNMGRTFHFDVMTVGVRPNTTPVGTGKVYTDSNIKELNMVFQLDHMHLIREIW